MININLIYFSIFHNEKYDAVKKIENNDRIIKNFFESMEPCKLPEMIKHIINLINVDLYINSIPSIVGNIYNWSSKGSIMFQENTIITTWGYGTYRWLDTHLCNASWSGIDHILIMNSSYTKFIGFSLIDLDIIKGQKINNLELGFQGYMGLQYHYEDACKEINSLETPSSNPESAIFAFSYFSKLKEMHYTLPIKYDYVFIGSIQSNRSARQWVIEFAKQHFTEHSLFINTDKGEWVSLGVFDKTYLQEGYSPKSEEDTQSRSTQFRIIDDNKMYFESLASSKFSLCPAGDQPWSFRFYETLMCGSIPIVESYHHTYRTAYESNIPYKYLLYNKPHIYDIEYIAENYNLFSKYHQLFKF